MKNVVNSSNHQTGQRVGFIIGVGSTYIEEGWRGGGGAWIGEGWMTPCSSAIFNNLKVEPPVLNSPRKTKVNFFNHNFSYKRDIEKNKNVLNFK